MRILGKFGSGAESAAEGKNLCEALFELAKKLPEKRENKVAEKRKNLSKGTAMIKYIAYCRRSIEQEEKQALSIEAQIAELKEFATREKLEVVEFLTEAKTAKVPGRGVFGQLIKRIQQGEVQGILAWHPDRLARNSVDGGQIIYLLDAGKILDLKFPTFWFDSTPQGKFMLSIAFSQSKYYVDNLSENVKRGNRQKLRQGVYPSKAPIGYYNEPRLRTIEVDRQTAPIVQTAFEMYGTGNYSMADIQRFFFKKGVRRKKNDKMLPMSQVQKLLSNTFYYGLMKYAGEFYEGIHKPLISKNLFEKVQQVQKQRGKPRKQAHNFPFVGMVRCGECGASVTAEEHYKFYPSTRGKVAYVYYHCTKRKIRQPCSQRYLNSIEFEKQLRELLAKVNIPQIWAEKWLERLDREQKIELGKVETNTAEINQKIQTVDQKLGRLLDVYLNQEVDLLSYQQKKSQLLEEKMELKEKIAETSKNGNDWFEPMRDFINVAADAAKTARAENNSQEIKLLAQKVGSNYSLLNRRLFCQFKKGFAEVFSFGGTFGAAPEFSQNPQMCRFTTLLELILLKLFKNVKRRNYYPKVSTHIPSASVASKILKKTGSLFPLPLIPVFSRSACHRRLAFYPSMRGGFISF